MNQKFLNGQAFKFVPASWLVSFFLMSFPALAQPAKEVQLTWKELSPSVLEKSSLVPLLQIEEGSIKVIDNRPYPLYQRNMNMPGGIYNVTLKDAVYAPVQRTDLQPYFPAVSEETFAKAYTFTARGKQQVSVQIIPLRRQNGQLQKLISCKIELKKTGELGAKAAKKASWAGSSVLGSGSWFKFSVNQNGVYRITTAELSNMGIPVNEIDPRTLKIYGHGGGLMPESSSIPRDGDIPEVAIRVVGENDGTMDGNDYILFYGEAPHKWVYDASAKKFRHQYHWYSDETFYFITYGGTNGKRIATQGDGQSLTEQETVTKFDDYAFHEESQRSFVKSGRDWWGEEFSNFQSVYNFAHDFPGLVQTDTASVILTVGARAFVPSNFTLRNNGSTLLNRSMIFGNPDFEAPYLTDETITDREVFFYPTGGVNLLFSYNNGGSINTRLYLNNYEVHVKRELNMLTSQMGFRNVRSLGKTVRFDLKNNGQQVEIWDVTDLKNVRSQSTYPNAGGISFKTDYTVPRQYWAFNGTSFLAVTSKGRVNNQNLHALAPADYIIITHPDFMEQANRLAAYHQQHDGYTTLIVKPQDIFNEFSSGSQDIVAMRDFLKMLYDKAPTPDKKPKYVLMLGDASVDYRGVIKNNSNFVPIYESYGSTAPTTSYCSDDYFVFLDDDEGDWENSLPHGLDMAVGRFPVRLPEEADAIINKIIRYDESSSYGNWRGKLTFVADDQDYNISVKHLDDAEVFATHVDTTYKVYNIDKIYADSYKLVAGAAGGRYPDVNTAIDMAVTKGSLIINYNGHGGEAGWGHERFLTMQQISAWNNLKNLPLFVTATCQFSRFDDPEIPASAGEMCILSNTGGAIAMFTTTRLVYQSENRDLNRKLYEDNVFEHINGRHPTVGEVYAKMKNESLGNGSARCFSLLGDPGITLAYPEDRATALSVNGKALIQPYDTARALTRVVVTGEILNSSGVKLNTYQGTLVATVYDKPRMQQTQMNYPWNSLSTYKLQKNIIYQGEASINNGDFTFAFIVPKDIDYQFGQGKISLYAYSNSQDGFGYTDQFIIGGSSDTASADATAPRVDLFMNDNKFVIGGLTNEHPDIYAEVFDENGINTVGNGIGHEITAVLDDNSQSRQLIVLNDYYQAKKDSYQEGTIRYPLSGLSEGKHTLTLKVWDVYNNSAEDYTEFIVARDAKVALDHVLNYPNPFVNRTSFQFDHNKTGQNLKVQVVIMTVSGKIVKTIHTDIPAARTHVDEITWDGLDDFGDKIGRGVYLYKVTVKAQDGSTAEKLEKLVVLQ